MLKTLHTTLLFLIAFLWMVFCAQAQVHPPHHANNEILIDQQEDWLTHLSESGRFLLHYVTEGSNSVPPEDNSGSGIPDFIELAASFADSTWRHLIQRHNYPDFISPDTTYTIYFRDSPYLGFTRKYNDGTQIILHRDFENIRSGNTTNPPPENSDPDGRQVGALKITMAHEIMHAIQYEILGDFHEGAWLEMDAVMVSHFVFPTVLDYLNDISMSSSIFNDPAQSTPVAYYHASLMIFFTEKYGLEFWADVWNLRYQNSDLMMLDATLQKLEQSGVSFTDDFTQMHLWHYASGNRGGGYGFQNSAIYPNARTTQQFSGLPEHVTNLRNVPALAAHYYEVIPEAEQSGAVLLSFYGNTQASGFGLLIRSEGQWHEILLTEDDSNIQHFDTGYLWENVDTLGVVIANSGDSVHFEYQFHAGSPETVQNLLLGDVTKSGAVTYMDGVYVLRHVIGKQPLTGAPFFQGDVTGDGKISAYDAYLIFSYLDADILTFPVDENGDGFGPDVVMFSPDYTPPMQPDSPEYEPEITLNLQTGDPRVNEPVSVSLDIAKLDSSFRTGSISLTFDDDIEQPEISLTGFATQDVVTELHFENSVLNFSFVIFEQMNSSQEININFTPLQDGKLNIRGITAVFNKFYELPVHWQNELEISVDPSVPVSAGVDELPRDIVLHQNYPNPFNPVTVISFHLPQAGYADVHVYDMLGRRIASLISGQLPEGKHSITFDATGFSSGMYIYQLGFENRVVNRKMILVK